MKYFNIFIIVSNYSVLSFAGKRVATNLQDALTPRESLPKKRTRYPVTYN